MATNHQTSASYTTLLHPTPGAAETAETDGAAAAPMLLARSVSSPIHSINAGSWTAATELRTTAFSSSRRSIDRSLYGRRKRSQSFAQTAHLTKEKSGASLFCEVRGFVVLSLCPAKTEKTFLPAQSSHMFSLSPCHDIFIFGLFFLPSLLKSCVLDNHYLIGVISL